MRTIGVLLLAIGVLSAIFYFLDMNFMFLNWIIKWGPDKAWMIRGGIILLGIIFYFMGKSTDKE